MEKKFAFQKTEEGDYTISFLSTCHGEENTQLSSYDLLFYKASQTIECYLSSNDPGSGYALELIDFTCGELEKLAEEIGPFKHTFTSSRRNTKLTELLINKGYQVIEDWSTIFVKSYSKNKKNI